MPCRMFASVRMSMWNCISSAISRPISSDRRTPRARRQSQVSCCISDTSGACHDFADGEHELLPAPLLDVELLAPGGGQLVEARPAVVLRHAPLRRDPPALLEPVERRIERALL